MITTRRSLMAMILFMIHIESDVQQAVFKKSKCLNLVLYHQTYGITIPTFISISLSFNLFYK